MSLRSKIKPAILALEDGTIFRGESFGAEGERHGEVVFNTGMTGYQEVLTDPSYRGQIVTMTYTQQGNYGINSEDDESWQPWVEGFVVREHCPYPSNFRASLSLPDYLKKRGIPGISGIDTRRLTKHLRTHGAKMGVISSTDLDPESVVEKARTAPRLEEVDFVAEVSCKQPHRWADDMYVEEGVTPDKLPIVDKVKPRMRTILRDGVSMHAPQIFRVVCMDWGIKQNILRHLYSRGCDIIVVPAKTTAEEVLEYKPDGVMLSNGPGDPAMLDYAIKTAQGVIGKVPVFGVCLGQQIIGWAMGGTTYKLKFGHRGCNHPVKNLLTGEVEITTQNHGFCVDMDTLKDSGMEMTHVNLNDMTCEGLRHKDLPLFCVQYHPEAGPGPHDANYL
ncbi:MAG TPA: glutamine-hydrolyzing carbamoyl-phosphate synthase small subunit, partial [Chloroflexota bacterium]|nr:glutamine-hydrolyzing carbamoyl-phosphate synthase small subunit [Chloroflexota bacterium]